MYCVTSATGNVGRHVVEALLRADVQVRVVVRSAKKAEVFGDRVQVSVADLTKPRMLSSAFEGAEGIFLLYDPSIDDEPLFAETIKSIHAVGSPRVVLLSTMGARDANVRLARAHALRESLLRQSALPWCIVRPTTFMSNVLRWADSIRLQGVVYNPQGDGQTAPVAPSDIGEVAARALRDASLAGETLELTGPALLSTPQQVAILSDVLCREIRTVEVPVAAAIQQMERSGIPAELSAALGQLFERIRAGHGAALTDTVQRILGRPPMTFEAWAREHVREFAAPEAGTPIRT